MMVEITKINQDEVPRFGQLSERSRLRVLHTRPGSYPGAGGIQAET
jgi:hypothetical protein